MATNAPPESVQAHQQQIQEDAHAQVLGIFDQDASKGAAVHVFDPDAPPEKKASVVARGQEKLKPYAASNNDVRAGKEAPIDTGAKGVLPTITVEDADQPTSEKPEKATPVPDSPSGPGAYPSGPAPEVPEWYKVGWRSIANVDVPVAEDEQTKDKAVLERFIPEQFYGDWYHNAGIIIFAVFASHFFTRFNFGWGWLFILLARELVKTRLASEHESADWLNNFLDRFWLIYEPVLSKSVVASVDQILSVSTPAFLDSLRLSTFTLGTKSPRIVKVRTFPNTEDDVVMMDWNLSFTPNDVSDITPRMAMKKVNPKIVLSVRVGRGLASAAMPILIEDVTFTGLLRVKLKLVSNFPHIQIVDITFLEKPTIDYVLKPVGGDTFGFDVAHIPGLAEFIREMIHGTLEPMMYDPNVFTLNLEQLLSGAPLDAAIGVVLITVEAARGLKGSKIGGGSPDPYVSVTINDRQELARTKHRNNTYNPTWAETKFILVNTLQEPLVLNVMDYNEHRKDTKLGSATFDLQKLQDDATLEGIERHLLKDGKERGLLRFNLSYYPVLKPEMVEGKEQLPNTNIGIVRLTVHQAKELDSAKSLTGDLNPLVKVYLGNEPSAIHRTQIIKHTNNPVWESPTEFLCLDKQSSLITLKIVDDRDILKDPVIGYMSGRLEDLLAGMSEGRDWWPLSGCKTGKIRISLQWKPLNMPGALSGVDQYVPPIGVVRLWLQKATDVKNVEAALGGKSDPYVRVLVNNVIKGRTEVMNNNLNPEWDQIIYIPVHSLRESMFMEVMDYQHLTKDRSLGSVELHVNELARESSTDNQYRHESTGKKEAHDPIKLDGGDGQAFHGRLHYVAEFIPCLNLKNVHFDADENEVQQAAKGVKNINKAVNQSPKKEERDVAVRQPIHDDQGQEREGTFGNGIADKVETNPGSDETKDEKETSGIELGKEELLKHQSGIIIFHILSGQLHKKARLEVLLDDGYWPSVSTIKARSTHAQWQHVGEAFIKELDFGRVWLRLNENAEGDKDDIIAEWKGNAKYFVDATLDRRCTYTLTNDEDKASSVVIETRYVPVPVKLEPRESINNQGVLRVELIGAKDLRAADRGGKSDPYAVFTLNGQKEFKSQTKKKTLHPEWNETFNVNVSSRVAADFTVEIFDWNQLEQAKSLGIGLIRLDDLEPLEAAERFITLSLEKHGEKGVVHLRMVFQPEIIARTRKSTSTFSVAGRAMTHIGSLPMEAGRGVLHGVGSIFRRDHEKEISLPSHPEVFAPATLPATQSLGSGAASRSAESLRAASGAPSDHGVLRVVVLNAKGLHSTEAKPYALVRVGDKEHKTKHGHSRTSTPEWNESFVFPASSTTSKLYVWVYDHKTLGKDKVLGEGEVEIWRFLQPNQSSVADLTANLREGGEVYLHLEFDVDANAHAHDPSVTSLERPTPVSPSRFSIRGRRPGATEDS
ncbi:C2 domain-containing protein [Pisolithus albus]|nr:C2 domain-containing protein [Pisolithus albus]